MSWLTSFLGQVVPGMMLRYEQKRIALDQLRGFSAAMLGRRTASWWAGGTSADAEALPALSVLRARSRDLVRNDPYARNAVRGLVNDIVGTGIRPRWKKANPTYEAWTRQCDAEGILNFAGITRLVCTSWIESGSVMIRRRVRRVEDGLRVPLQLQVLEIDHLDSSKTGYFEGAQVIGGIAFDAIGRRTGYWLFPEHPGSVNAPLRSLASKFVPASEIIHLFRRDRPGQHHGVPALAVIALWLKEIGEGREADLVRRKIEACFVAMVTDEGSDTLGSLQAAAVGDKPAQERVSPGMIKYLKPGQKVQFGSPTPGSGWADTQRMGLGGVAAGFGTTYERMTGDLSQVNYSSIRAGERPYRAEVASLQWLTFIPQFIEGVMQWYAELELLAGVTRKVTLPLDYTTPRIEYVDPQKEVDAKLSEVSGGLKSLSEHLRADGYEPASVFDEIAAEREYLAAKGITLAFSKPAAAPAPPADDPAPADSKNPKKD